MDSDSDFEGRLFYDSDYSEMASDIDVSLDGSFSSTEFSFSEAPTTQVSESEMSSEDSVLHDINNSADENEEDDINVVTETGVRFALRSRRITGGNVAPIPPSRLDNLSSSDNESSEELENHSEDGADANVNSPIVLEDGDSDIPFRLGSLSSSGNESSSEELENDNEDGVEAPVVVEDSDVQNRNNDQPPPDPADNVTVNVEDQQQENDEAVGLHNEENDNRQNSPVRTRRRPLSEIISAQHSPDEENTQQKLDETGVSKAKRKRVVSPVSSDDGDDGMTCSVCLDSMTNSGLHRIVSLYCGHLFGRSCVERWLKSGCMGGTKRCPTCNKKANLRDIRTIYAKKLKALDTAERDRINSELNKVKEEKARLEMDLTKVKLNFDMQRKQVELLQQRIESLESERTVPDNKDSLFSTQIMPYRSATLVNNVLINKHGGCRVLGCSTDGLVVVSQKSPTPYFFQYGICMIHPIDQKSITVRCDIHKHVVRDLAFNPLEKKQLLTVSLDRTAKITDITSNRVAIAVSTNNLLWSCVWDSGNPHHFLTGSQNGIVSVYDTRYPRSVLDVYNTPGDTTPVVSLASVQPVKNSVFERGGFLSCRLNSVYALHNGCKRFELVMLDGPYISLNYNPSSQSMLLSTRPSSRHQTTRHIISQLATSGESKFSNDVHMFTCGTSGQLMSRSCHMLMPNGDIWVGAHNESNHTIELLSVNKNGPIHEIPTFEPVFDICPITINNTLFLGSVSEKSFFVHKLS